MSAGIEGRTGTAALTAAVWAALAEVCDPELDEPLTDLGFVAGCDVSEAGTVRVRLRLPTYFCAPNFAFLMVDDAHAAVSGVPGVTGVEVVLDDHFASDAINRGVAAHDGFVATFPGLAEGELGELRREFGRKAVLAATDEVCRSLLAAGRQPADLSRLRLGDAPPSRARDRLRSRRAGLGLPAGDDAALVVDPATGAPVPPDGLAMHLHRARLTRVSMEANGAVCRGLLRERYLEVDGGVEVEVGVGLEVGVDVGRRSHATPAPLEQAAD